MRLDIDRLMYSVRFTAKSYSEWFLAFNGGDILGTLGFIAFTFFLYVGSARNNGMLFVLLLACIWMALEHQRRRPSSSRQPSFYQQPEHSLKNSSNDKLAATFLFGTVLVVHALVGGFAFYTDFREVFSPTKDVVSYLRARHLDKHRIVVAPDYCGTGLSTYLHRRVYSLSNLQEITYERLGSDRKAVWGASVPWRLSRLVQWWNQPFILLSRDRLYFKLPVGHAKLLKRFRRTIVGDEGKYLYLIEPEKSTGKTANTTSNASFIWNFLPTQRVQRFFINQSLFQTVPTEKYWTPRGSQNARWFQFRLKPIDCAESAH